MLLTYGYNYSFIPPPQNTSGDYAKEHRTESTQYDTKLSAKTLNKHQIFTPKVKESVFPKEPIVSKYNLYKTLIENEKTC